MNVIEIRNLSKKYSNSRNVEVMALRHVNLNIEKGRFVAIVGPNRMLERNYEDLKVYYNDSRTLFHDYRAHITLLQKYLEENQIDKACLYLNSINKPLAELEKKIYTGNAVIDLVMNYKLSELKEKNIKIEYDIMPIDFGNYHFEESDIFVILYNLFDNAIGCWWQAA